MLNRFQNRSKYAKAIFKRNAKINTRFRNMSTSNNVKNTTSIPTRYEMYQMVEHFDLSEHFPLLGIHGKNPKSILFKQDLEQLQLTGNKLWQVKPWMYYTLGFPRLAYKKDQAQSLKMIGYAKDITDTMMKEDQKLHIFDNNNIIFGWEHYGLTRKKTLMQRAIESHFSDRYYEYRETQREKCCLYRWLFVIFFGPLYHAR